MLGGEEDEITGGVGSITPMLVRVAAGIAVGSFDRCPYTLVDRVALLDEAVYGVDALVVEVAEGMVERQGRLAKKDGVEWRLVGSLVMCAIQCKGTALQHVSPITLLITTKASQHLLN